jgi:DNA (cytosine-5)-methyltransferase 1
MGDGSIPVAPIWDDITTLSKTAIDIPIDIIVGGFPCQDISVAGKGAGLEGERSGLFFEIVRLAKEIKPAFLFLENVPAIRTRGLDTVIQELTAIGYDCRWTMLSAADVGANHKRERWFLLAHTEGERRDKGLSDTRRCAEGMEPRQEQRLGDGCSSLADTSATRLEVQQEPAPSSRDWWATEPSVGRVAHGVPQRVDRIKRLGNAVVPQQAKEAFKILMGIK